MLGLQGVLGFSEKFYALFELDHVVKTVVASGTETKSVYQLMRIGYEVKKGFHLAS